MNKLADLNVEQLQEIYLKNYAELESNINILKERYKIKNLDVDNYKEIFDKKDDLITAINIQKKKINDTDIIIDACQMNGIKSD